MEILKAFKIEEYEKANAFMKKNPLEVQGMMVDSGHIIIRIEDGENDVSMKKTLTKEIREEKGKIMAYNKNLKIAAKKIERMSPEGYVVDEEYAVTKKRFKDAGFKNPEADSSTALLQQFANEGLMNKASIVTSEKTLEVLEEMLQELD